MILIILNVVLTTIGEYVQNQLICAMTNNDVLRRLRYVFDYSDEKMLDIFASGNLEVSRALLSDWLKKDKDPEFKLLYDNQLAHFLNGFINEKRGKKEGLQPAAENELNNNIILRKLKIALNMKVEEMVDIYKLIDVAVSTHEINAFFRKPGKGQYMICGDQYLRNFLQGLQSKYRN